MGIAVIGAAGQLGRELVARLGTRAVPLTHHDIEICNPDSVAAALRLPDLTGVINCAAYNFVDQAEREPERALQVNALGPRCLALHCGRLGLPLLHVSTDYVFGGDASRTLPYAETDLPAPLSAYGVSKLAGEQFVRALAPRHFIVRTCGLYGTPSAAGKGNFVRTIERLAREKPELQVVNDQRCTPTDAGDLADALMQLFTTDAWGTYHATNSGDCTWFDLAVEIVRLRGLGTRVTPRSSDDPTRPARRPAYSVLDCTLLSRTLGKPLRPWRAALADYLGSDAT